METAILQLDLDQVNDEIMNEIRKIDGVKEVYATAPNVIRIHCAAINGAVYPILEEIKSKNLHINQINSLAPSVEDVFLKLTGEKK